MLTAPPPSLQRRSAELLELIKQDIEGNDGWISFERYMQHALYAPALGYYSAGMQKFGNDGDFVTAPMLGDMFAFALARQCDEIFQQFPDHSRKTIVECGAGDGKLAVDLLRQMQARDCKVDQYLIMETSADLQQRQQETLFAAGLLDDHGVKWLNALPDDGIEGIVLANELLDALPVKRFAIDENGIAREMGVALSQDRLVWCNSDLPLDDPLQKRLSTFSLDEGYQSEIGAQSEAWIRSVGEKLLSGAMILVDYGFSDSQYYHPDRVLGTLMCHYRHHAHDDPFYFPGLQDVTAHVDFTAVKAAGESVGLTASGYSSQGGFLLSLGILDRLQACQQDPQYDQKTLLELSNQIKTLTLPHEMGELFKVMILATNSISPLSGFSLQNHVNRL